MSAVTLYVLDGADRGRTFYELPIPVTIGREEGNSIQLNDERVSRFHLKIQEDHEKFVLTDLDSTNGTKVNGEETRLHILRFGDVVSVGRSVLLFGTRDQIAKRLAELRGADGAPERTLKADSDHGSRPDALDMELHWSSMNDPDATLQQLAPPELPDRLSPGQAAQLSELLSYFHQRIRNLISTVSITATEEVLLDSHEWQNLVDLQAEVARYLREISEPPAD